jgi:predicted TIM-barrel fold metal-dependent hydrolase
VGTIEQLAGIKIVDADTHITEPHDLWTSRAPDKYKDRVPSVTTIDGQRTWVFDGNVLGMAGGASVIRRDGSKIYDQSFIGRRIDDIYPNYEIPARLEMMDKLGIWAHIVFPNVVGFGGQGFAKSKDPELRTLSVNIWNEAMAEFQEDSDGRLFPMAFVPWWEDISTVVQAVQRIKALGLKGLNTNADPQDQGFPDLNDRYWDPLWEVASDLGLPINFHDGASETQMSWYGPSPWPSFEPGTKMAIGSAVMFMNNGRVLANILFSGMLERFPRLKIVSVESGIGWIPFILDVCDYQLHETAPAAMEHLTMKPSEYFRRQVYSCFWFESTDTIDLINRVGVDNCLFETDFPHPTCLYPDSLKQVARSLEGASEEMLNKVFSTNAAKVYSLDL